MDSNPRLLTSISVSFENNHGATSNCSVEINLQPNSPNRDEVGYRIEGMPINIKKTEADAVECHQSSDHSKVLSHSSLESRNDDGESQALISPQTAADVPTSIFRPVSSNTTAALSSQESARSQSPDVYSINQQKSKAESNALRKHPPAVDTGADRRRTFASSVSYDGLFEVRKSHTSRQGVTLADGEGARSINLLYDELRQISTVSIALADEALDKESSFVGIASNNTEILSKRLSLFSKADEMLLQARKACASYHQSEHDNNYNSSFLADRNESAEEQAWKKHQKEFLHQRIKRTQSLDRVLSTKEVLDFATQALQQKENCKRRTSPKDPFDLKQPTSRDTTVSWTPTSASEQEAPSETTTLSPEDKKLRDTLKRIQAKSLGGLHSMSKTCSSASEQTLPEDPERSPPPSFPSFLPEVSSASHDKALKRLDGIKDTSSDDDSGSMKESKETSKMPRKGSGDKRGERETAAFSLMRYLWGGDEDEDGRKGLARVAPAMLACGPGTRRQLNEELKESGLSPYENKFASMATSLMRRGHERFPSFPEMVANKPKADPRMRDWIDGQFAPKEDLPLDGQYLLGKSRTVVVHEIVRGNWTWCTAWSPDGTKLAIATETHHLAIVDTSTSVWRVTHDKRIVGPVKNDTTHSVRSIAWGVHFIAIGGTGNAVSILAPLEPYPILHTITGTGFVGSLSWRIDSTVLAIGSRVNKAMLVAFSPCNDVSEGGGRQLHSDILETIPRKNWVNVVAFSPGGFFFAVGDAGGQLSIFRWADRGGSDNPHVTPVTTFTMEDSVLAISFSPDGKWLYSGGEDMRVTIISTNHWEIVHRLRRNRWVQCVGSSRSSSHVAVGGVNSEVSILEVGLGWDTVINIELKGLVPLSVCWHPRDQYLAVTGQSQSILVVETTNARHVSGHFLRSISPILAVDFSPDGRHAVIGNQQVITFFKLQGEAFVIAYEMVVAIGDSLCIRWSPDGSFVAVGSQNLLLIVGQTQQGNERSSRPEGGSQFSIRRVLHGLGDIKTLSISSRGRYVVACGTKMEVLEVSNGCKSVRSFDTPTLESNALSADGRWMATIGQSKTLTVFSTESSDCDRWSVVVSLEVSHAGRALAFGPTVGGGLVYVAFGGDDKAVTVVEIRTSEGTWETVLRAPRDGVVYDLDWNEDGLLAVAVGNGTVSIIDLSYLRAGLAVNQMDYKAQRQALTCFTEIRRNRGRNRMKTVRWIPCNGKGSSSMLAVGGTDGEVEIVDLGGRERCDGYS